jgi:sugar phosphate isomerase/epimerase
MQIQFIKALWGMDEPLEQALAKIEAAGYQGFETNADDVLRARSLGFHQAAVAQIYEAEIDGFKRGLDKAVEAQAILLNVHAGRDFMSFDAGCAYLEEALRLADEAGMKVGFETHRGRLLFESRSSIAYMQRFPNLRITADLSHWTCVHESLLEDQEDAVELAVQRAAHVHARVGFEEGPQVPDPRVAQWERCVTRFEGIWDRMKSAHEARGESVMTVTPEFGPPNYMWTDPQTGQPAADLWDVCLWMKDRLQARWA